jgi:arylformamidase
MTTTLYDISITLGEESFPFPGDPPFAREMVLTLKESGICNVSKLTMSAHSGTHIDLPSHFIGDGKNLDTYPADRFILPARVWAVLGKKVITAAHVRDLVIEPGDAILLKTDNSETGRCKSGTFSENFVHLSPEAADICIQKKAGFVGIDYITIEKDTDNAVHRKILGAGIPILEGINLKGVPPGRYTLLCLPLKIKGGEASPVRAILLDGPIHPVRTRGKHQQP